MDYFAWAIAILDFVTGYAIGLIALICARAVIRFNARQYAHRPSRNSKTAKRIVKYSFRLMAIELALAISYWTESAYHHSSDSSGLGLGFVTALIGCVAGTLGLGVRQRRQTVETTQTSENGALAPHKTARSAVARVPPRPEPIKSNPTLTDFVPVIPVAMSQSRITERAHNEIILPPEIQQMLPVGSRVLSFDGEVVYRTTVPAADTHLVDYRMYSLTPFPDPKTYPRRWDGKPVQDTYMSIEHFHGHLTTMYFLYLPKKDNATTGHYRAESIAAVSLSTGGWLQVTTPKAVELILEGSIQGRMVKELWNVMRPGGYAKRLDKNNQNSAALDQVVMYLRFEFERNKAAELGTSSGGRI